MTKCRVCNKVLTNPISVELGIGPVCRGGYFDYQLEFDFEEDSMKAEAINNFGDVKYWRDEDGANSNVPHRIVRHSPTGFEWGYGGSGPAEFALNILSCYIGEEAADRGLYQSFKWEIISALPHEGGVIKREAILEWLKEKGV